MTNTNAQQQTNRDAQHAKMTAAFAVVDPTCQGRDWKAPIDTYGSPAVFERLCTQLNVTLDDVLEAIRFFTATEPTVTREPSPAGEILRIRADGYRKGPAGDH
jgi:hypothetical protein